MEKEEQAAAEVSELDKLFPPAVKVTLGADVVIDLHPMDLMTCARFARVAKPIMEEVASGGKLTDGAIGSTTLMGGVLLAIVNHPEEFVEAMAIATGQPASFVGRLPPAAASSLLMYVIAVNSDFFSQSVASLASDAKATTLESARHGAGLTH